MSQTFMPLMAPPASAAPSTSGLPASLFTALMPEPAIAAPQAFRRLDASPAHDTLPAPRPAPAPVVAPPVHTAPTVTIKREGDQITHVTIRCGCGEVIELACVY